MRITLPEPSLMSTGENVSAFIFLAVDLYVTVQVLNVRIKEPPAGAGNFLGDHDA